MASYSNSMFIEILQEKSLLNQNEYQQYSSWVELDDVFLKIIEKNIHESDLEFGEEPKLPDFLSNLQYDKKIPENLTGLHREILYSLDFDIQESVLDLHKLESEQCSLYIIDYCDNKFYIDSEEIQPMDNIQIFENSKMNIEQMDANSNQYVYALKMELKKENVKSENGKRRISIRLQVPYHLRYNQANYEGISEAKLGKNFDFMLNCLKMEQNKDSKISRRTKWFMNTDPSLKNTNNLLIQLNSYQNPEIFIIPVGNKTFRRMIKKSTIFFVMSGMFYLVYKILKFKDS